MRVVSYGCSWQLIAVAFVSLMFSSCSKESAETSSGIEVSNELFEQVAPTAFDGVDPAEQETLEIKERRGTLFAENRARGVVGKFFTDSNAFSAPGDDNDVALELTFGSILREGADGKPSNSQSLKLRNRQKEGNVVKRRNGAFEEYFVNDARGIEHGLVIAKKPEGEGKLIANVVVGGGFRPSSMSPTDVAFEHPSGARFNYSGLRVFDAKRRRVPAMMWPQRKGSGYGVRIEVYDSEATYPIVIDPVISRQLERIFPATLAKPACAAPGSGLCGLGRAVALHGDVMVVGLPEYSPPATGAVQIYLRDGDREVCTVTADCEMGETCVGDRCLEGGVTTDQWYLSRTIEGSGATGWTDYGASVDIAQRPDESYIIAVGDPRADGEGRGEILQIDRATLLAAPTAGEFRIQHVADGAGELLPGGAIAPMDEFGFSVAATPDSVVFGQPAYDMTNGRVVKLDWATASTYSFAANFDGTTVSTSGRRFGHTVDLSDRFIAVGAPTDGTYQKIINVELILTMPASTSEMFEMTVRDGMGVNFTAQYLASNFDNLGQIRDGLVTDFNGSPASPVSALPGGMGGEIALTAKVDGDNFTVINASSTMGKLSILSQAPLFPAFTPSYAALIDLNAPGSPILELGASPGLSMGWDVATEGDIWVYGSPTAGGAGDSGEVSSFTIDRMNTPATISPLVNDVGAAGDRLGTSVATDGVDVFAGAPGATVSSIDNQGYVRNISGTWGVNTLSFPTAPGWYVNDQVNGPGFQLGYTLSVDPVTSDLIAGLPGLTYDRNFGGTTGPQGAVAVLSGGAPQSVTTRQADVTGYEFGHDVDIAGNLMVVSAPGATSVYRPGASGVVYLYSRGAPTADWTLVEVIEAPTQITDTMSALVTGIGPAVATNGTDIAVEVQTATQKAVVFYTWDSGTSTLTRQRTGVAPEDGVYIVDNVMSPVSGPIDMDYDGTTLVVGAFTNDAVMQMDTTNLGTAIDVFSVFTPVTAKDFGMSVSVNDALGRFAVGAPGSNTNTGAVYTYNSGSGAMAPLLEVTVPDMPPFDTASLGIGGNRFGTAVAFENLDLVVSEPQADGGEGRLFFFQYKTGPDALVPNSFDGGGADFQVAANTNWNPTIVAGGYPITPGSQMGSKLDIISDGTTTIVAASDWGQDAVLGFVYDATGQLWAENDFSKPTDSVTDDVADGAPLYYPNSLAIDDARAMTGLEVAAGSPDTLFLINESTLLLSGAVTFQPLGGVSTTPDDNCDGVDDDTDGPIDEDSCGALGAAGCVDPVGSPGLCYTTCPMGTCGAMETCVIDPAISPTIAVCKPDAGCAMGERARNGVCMEECDPSAPACSAGSCYDDPAVMGLNLGLCAPTVDICNSPGFFCGVDDEGDPETCYQGECLEPCAGDIECDAAPGGKCLGVAAFPGVGAGTYCDYPTACGDTWCIQGTECYEGQCYDICDADPATNDCVTTDPVSGGGTACYIDLGPGSAACHDGGDACAGIVCPPYADGSAQVCDNGECFEACSAMAPACTQVGEVCNTALGYCAPPDPCTTILCLETDTCYEGSCFEDCDPTGPVTCGPGTECVQRPGSMVATDGICVDTADPCAGISCPPNIMGDPRTCYLGDCVLQCTVNADCNANELCDTANNRCVANDICDNVICPTGDTCTDGYCYTTCDPALAGADCAVGELCAVDPAAPTNGRCAPDTPDPCDNIFCPPDAAGAQQICYEGSCYPTCVDDDDCAPPDLCFSTVNGNICNAPDPCDSVWCPVGDVCYAGSCYSSCVTTCANVCASNNDGTNRCTMSLCDGVTCPVGEFCMNGVCGSICTVDSDCPDSLRCEDPCAIEPLGSNCTQGGDGRCLPSPCQYVNCPVGDVCVSGTCGVACMVDGECGAGEVCYDGGCVADPCNPDPCPAGETCHGGACYDSCTPATVALDCTAGQVCTDNRCTESACTGVDCPVGQVCFEGSCWDTCADDGECTPPNICSNGLCAADPCTGVTCPVGEVCYGGSCAPPCGSLTACQNDGACSGGESCENINPDSTWGFCMDCGTDDCWAFGCVDDSECGTGRYCARNGTSLSGACLPNGCDPSTGCTDGMLSCRASACEGVQCPVGQVCYEGSCYDPCASSDECTPPNECYDGVCTTDLCRGTNCPVGQVCYAGSCYDPCASDDECVPPSLCFEGRCADDACTGVNCPVGDICIQGGCFQGCMVNTDCDEYVGTGDFVDTAGGSPIQISGNKEGGFTWADFNNDGCLDLVVNTDNSLNTRYMVSDCNLPDPGFTDVTFNRSEYLGDERGEFTVVAGDLNNDGYVDIVRTGDDTELFLNRGPANFQLGVGGDDDPNDDWGGSPEGAGILDYNGDQLLDFIVQVGDRVKVYRNDGGGNFSELEPEEMHNHGRDGDYCAVADWDVDGRVDVMCRFERTNNSGRDMFRNTGGSFTAVDLVNEDGGEKSGGVFCDYDNDGDFDLFWGGDGTNQFWEQPSTGNWTPTGRPLPASGFNLNEGGREVEGVDCGDVDNDGDMDLFVSRGQYQDKLFINQLIESGSVSFVEDDRGIAGATGPDSEQGTMVDFDNDGDLDIYVNHDSGNYMWENPVTGSDYIMIRPRVDLGGGIYRTAIGATITIEDPDGNVLGVREANGGSGRGSQRQIPVHVGLQNGDNVPYRFIVQFPHSPVEVVERCIVPNTMSGYRVLNIDNTDADNTTACSVPSNWRDDIITPNSGEYCFEDHCAANACDDIQCSSGFICVGGSCVSSCTNSSECPMGEICFQGRCADENDPACDNVKCPSNQTCYAGECFKDCSTTNDCDGNQICYQDRCADPTCNKIAGNCLTGEICHQGTCFVDCTSDPSVCGPGETCWAGRCATDSCAAMMDTYQTNHTFTVLGRKLTADQYSRPFMWPRPIVGPAGSSITNYANFTAGSSTVGGVHAEGKARIAVYLDSTLADGDNPEGRYVVWLTHGRSSAGQTAARANYHVTLNRNGTTASLAPLFIDDANEAHRHLTDGDREILVAQITSEDSTTGGIAFGPLPARLDDWSISIDANFSGGIDGWEFYNPELGVGTELKMGEQVVLRSLPMSPDVVLSPETGFACNMPVEAFLQGNCDNGVLACSTGNFGFTRCDQAVFPANSELCDGEDNNCNGSVDETLPMRVPYVQFNQNDGWKYWVPADSPNTFFEDMNFTARGGDDRTGSTGYIGLEGMPMQAKQKSAAIHHRNLRTGELTVGFLHSDNSPGGGDREVRMELDYPGNGAPGTESFRDASIAYFDDATPAADNAPNSLNAANFAISLEWTLVDSGTSRESDGFGIRPRYQQYATGQLSYFDVEFNGSDDDNDDWTDDGLQWLMYQPMLLNGNVENELFKSQELDMRTVSLPISGAFCPAATPLTAVDPITMVTETCELGWYTCNSGELSCSAAVLQACDECFDADGDGYPLYDPALCPTGTDCNDQVFDINPGAMEQCNGIDDDCEGTIDQTNDPILCDGAANCGPAECDYRNVCVCPDGPENPLDPPSEPCFCSAGLSAGDEPAEPQSADDAALFEDRGAACSAAGGAPLEGDLPLLLLLGVGGLVARRRRR